MRIGIWTTASLESGIEAVSNEVLDLANAFDARFVAAVSPFARIRLRRAPLRLTFTPRIYPALRVLFPMMETLIDVSHVYGEYLPWVFYKSLRKKPVVLTVASEKGEPSSEMMSLARVVTVQSEHAYSMLRSRPDWRDKVHLVYPGIDLARFRPAEDGAKSLASTPRILFATFPRAEQEFVARGVTLLLDCAAACPEASFSILTRPWSVGRDAIDALQSQIKGRDLRNVRVIDSGRVNMPGLYREHDLTVIPFTTRDGGKECPLSMVEGFGCGLPVMISRACPFAAVVERHGCGTVFDPTVASFRTALRRATISYRTLSVSAQEVALRLFDRTSVLEKFAELYERARGARL